MEYWAKRLTAIYDMARCEASGWAEENYTKTGCLRPGPPSKMPPILRDDVKLGNNDCLVLRRIKYITSYYETVVTAFKRHGKVRRWKKGFHGPYGNTWEVLLGWRRSLARLKKSQNQR
jgi:hypothetical protein